VAGAGLGRGVTTNKVINLLDAQSSDVLVATLRQPAKGLFYFGLYYCVSGDKTELRAKVVVRGRRLEVAVTIRGRQSFE
jgi:hypothetical protein